MKVLGATAKHLHAAEDLLSGCVAVVGNKKLLKECGWCLRRVLVESAVAWQINLVGWRGETQGLLKTLGLYLRRLICFYS